MKPHRPVDLVLIDAAETILRKPSRRPSWLRAGYPMALILTQKRQQLLEFLADEPSLREYLRRRWRSLVEADGLDGLVPERIAQALELSTDPDRLIAGALINSDDHLARAAGWWAEDLSRIPEPHPRSDSPGNVSAPEAARRSEESCTDRAKVAEGEVSKHSNDSDGVAAFATLSTSSSTRSDEKSDAAVEHAARLLLEDKLDTLARDLDDAEATIRRLEAVNLELRAKVPTRADRRRANKELGKLQRASGELVSVTGQAEALREERDSLLARARRAEDDLDEAIEARRSAERSRRSLEERLATVEGRADYLRRSLNSEMDSVRLEQEQSMARDKTRARRRLDELTSLKELLDRLYPSPTEPVAVVPSEDPASVVVHDERAVLALPLGGAEEIGGSAVLVRMGDIQILVDAGMRPDGGGPRKLADLLAQPRIDAVVVTHAHNDHAGYVPALLQRFRAPVIASTATAQLLPTMWNDSASVMRRTFEEAGELSDVPMPLYGESEVEEAERQINEVPYHRARRIGDVELTLFPAGHILGAAGVVLSAGGHRIVVTGDVTAPSEEHLAVHAMHLPIGLVRDADLLVTESTYCHGNHVSRQHEVASLVDTVRAVVERRGRVLIPAFGLGRAQEVALILASELPEVEVLIDGLAKTVSEIYENISVRDAGSLRIFTGRVRRVDNRSREINAFQSGVIVSTSGMLNGGPSVKWAQSILPEENDALLLCGYQDEYAPGRRLEALTRHGGPRELELPDLDEGSVVVPVRAHVQRYQLSAHADRAGLLEIVKEVNPSKVMLVHGEARHQREFRHVLSRSNFNTVPTQEWKL